MKLTIKRLDIANYRSLENVSFDFNNESVLISGSNHIGKTTIIECCYWILTNNVLKINNTKSYAFLFNQKKEVDKVEATLIINVDDMEHSIKRSLIRNKNYKSITYNSILTIDDIEYSTLTKANEMLYILLNIPVKLSNNIYTLNTITNIDYLFKIVDKKDLRYLIISMLKIDKRDFEINNKEEINKIIGSYGKFDGNLNQCKTYYQNIIKKNKETQSKYLNQIQYINSKYKKPSEEEYKVYLLRWDEIQQEKNKILSTKKDLENKLNEKYNELTSFQFEEMNTFTLKKDKFLKEKEKLEKELNRLQKEAWSFDNQQQINKLNKESIISIEKEKEDYVKELDYIKSDSFIKDNSIKCPKCNATLNYNDLIKLQNEKIDIYNHKIKILDNQLIKLKSIPEVNIKSIDNIKIEIQKIEEELNKLIEDNIIYNDIYKPSLAIQAIKEQYKGIKDALDNYMDNSYQNDTIRLKSFIIEENDISSKIELYKNGYVEEPEEVVNMRKEISKLSKDNNNLENNIKIVDNLIKKYVSLLEEKVKEVFKDLKIELIKENIKENSWDFVCNIKNIVNNKVDYSSSSTSEKILTSLYLIERIKEYYSLPNLPIFIDELESLDNDSIDLLNTNSQIIATSVNNNKSILIKVLTKNISNVKIYM